MVAEQSLIIKAMEKDIGSSDLLGTAKPITWKSLCDFEGTVKHNVDVLDEKGKKSGNVVFKTDFKWCEYNPPKPSEKLNSKSLLRVIIKEAKFEKDADTFGKQDPFIQFAF